MSDKYSFFVHRNDDDEQLLTRINLDAGNLSEGELDSLIDYVIGWAEDNSLHVYSFPVDSGDVAVTPANQHDSFAYMQQDDISPDNPEKLGIGATVEAAHDITYGMLYPELVGTEHYNGDLVCVVAGTIGTVYHKPDPSWYVHNKKMIGVRFVDPDYAPELDVRNSQYVSYDWIRRVPCDNQSEH